MRARNIKPGFYKNAELLECSPMARLIVPGLWMLADRDGRLEDRPKQLKVEILPCDNVDVSALLDELARANHIVRYEIAGKQYIQILKFKEHQKPHPNEKASVIPPFCEALRTKVVSTSYQGDTRSALNDESLLLNVECGMLNDEPRILNDKPLFPQTSRVLNGKKWDVLSNLSEKALAKAKKNAPGWDIYYLARVYNEGVPDRGVPDDPDLAFPGWCKKYTKGKQP